jgi:hypothetical protein
VSGPTAQPARPARRLGGTFLGGAGGRLLPLSVPLRWFGAAAGFHLCAWVALALGAGTWPHWHGGLGWPLAALHALTLGTLAASAIGASLQLLPVATRQPVRWPWLAGALWWLFVPGALTLLFGMGLARPQWLGAGAVVVLAVLLAWGALLALNLHGARGMPGVLWHGRIALAALLLLVFSAAALVLLWLGRPLLARDSARALHLAAGVFGLMGMLVFGLATILLPMFALASVPPERQQLAGAAAGTAALVLAALAALAPSDAVAAPAARVLALAAAAVAFALHWLSMRRVLATGMRRELGRSARLMRIGWASGALALALAAAVLVLDARGSAQDSAAAAGKLFVLAAVGGWLASFLFAILQRILPFLAAMHAARGRRRAPTPSALTLDAALAWHERGHLAALALLALAVLQRDGPWLLLAAACGGAGALAFALFVAVLWLRLRRAVRDAESDAEAGAA